MAADSEIWNEATDDQKPTFQMVGMFFNNKKMLSSCIMGCVGSTVFGVYPAIGTENQGNLGSSDLSFFFNLL